MPAHKPGCAEYPGSVLAKTQLPMPVGIDADELAGRDVLHVDEQLVTGAPVDSADSD